ncbi:MAG: SRPBCC family protein [Miltoncostaeaceae bacterium]
MASVSFQVRHAFSASPREVWDALVDWKSHEEWVPSTRMEVEPGDPTAEGATFTAFTGVGRLALEDRMRVIRCDWSEDTTSGECEVEKLGPYLTGRAGFTIGPKVGGGTVVDWTEDLNAPRVPQFAAPAAAWIGATGFRRAMRKLDALLGEGGSTEGPASEAG